MTPDLVSAEYVKEYIIHVRFADGVEGDLDLKTELYGPIFEPLKDEIVFQHFEVHPELRTLTWPNGADFAPEFLYRQVQIPA